MASGIVLVAVEEIEAKKIGTPKEETKKEINKTPKRATSSTTMAKHKQALRHCYPESTAGIGHKYNTESPDQGQNDTAASPRLIAISICTLLALLALYVRDGFLSRPGQPEEASSDVIDAEDCRGRHETLVQGLRGTPSQLSHSPPVVFFNGVTERHTAL